MKSTTHGDFLLLTLLLDNLNSMASARFLEEALGDKPKVEATKIMKEIEVAEESKARMAKK